jgi:hypothetical protein
MRRAVRGIRRQLRGRVLQLRRCRGRELQPVLAVGHGRRVRAERGAPAAAATADRAPVIVPPIRCLRGRCQPTSPPYVGPCLAVLSWAHYSNLTPIFIGMHRNAPLSPMKRVLGYTIPMVPMHLAPRAHMNLADQIRALSGPSGNPSERSFWAPSQRRQNTGSPRGVAKRKSYRVGPKFLSWPNILTENPNERLQDGPTFGPTL